MTEDDDWFERALREDDADENGPDENGAEGSSDPDGADSGFADDADSAGGAFDGDATTGAGESDGLADAPEPGGAPFGDDEAEDFGAGDSGSESSDAGFGSADDPGRDAPSGGFADADPYDPDDADGGDDLFEEDFATAFENAPGGGAPGAGPGGESAGGGFGSGSGGGFGMDAGEGFGGGEPFEDEAFDDEEFESDIPRIDLGIDGLDDMIQGGVPERSLITTVGSAGTGKTTFGLQFLHEALAAGESAVFITLEESHDRILNTAGEKGWDFEAYEDEGSLAVIDLDPIEMANSLTSIRNDLPRLVEDFGATRLVLDSVSLLEMMYDDQATRRNEVYDFTRSLKDAGVTTMLTSEASEDNAYASRHGIIEYLVDAVFVLRYIRSSDDFRETRLAVEIQKIRDANHSREIKPYAITNDGISVYRQANIF
ncbi:KaiC domain-containing protein [Halorussus sp. AFM4]|uniref:KaiC domain-containing protein n=1 Tax=Halorussus sp. AFM4 TaxID=3421651 RepID=UPI003EBEEDBE